MIELHPKIITQNGESRYVVLPYEEFVHLQAALEAGLQASVIPSPAYGEFWANLGVEELAARQGLKPSATSDDLYGTGRPEDWAGFDEALLAWRSEPLVS